LATVDDFQVGVDRAFADELVVELGQVGGSVDSKVQLLVFSFRRCWHDHLLDLGIFGSSHLQFGRFVARALRIDADHKCASDLAEVVTVWIVQAQFLMEHNMVFHPIDFGQGDFDGADQVAFEEALVVDINLYHGILRIVFL